MYTQKILKNSNGALISHMQMTQSAYLPVKTALEMSTDSVCRDN